MKELLLKEEVYAVVGAAMEIHKDKGFGFSEAIYQECIEIELASRGIPFVAQKEMPVFYKGRRLKKSYLADLIVMDKLIIELKAID